MHELSVVQLQSATLHMPDMPAKLHRAQFHHTGALTNSQNTTDTQARTYVDTNTFTQPLYASPTTLEIYLMWRE